MIRRSKSQKSKQPTLLLAIWFVAMAIAVAVTVPLQIAIGLPFELYALVTLAPFIAYLATISLRHWRPSRWQTVSAARWAMSIISACLTIGVVGLLFVAIGYKPHWQLPTAGASIGVFLLLQIFGAFTEEVGWRGLVQHCGEAYGHRLVVAGLSGFIFGLLHFSFWSLGFIPSFTFSLTAMFLALTIVTTYNGSFWQRMVPATILHTGANLMLVVFAPNDLAFATSPIVLAATIVMFIFALCYRQVWKKVYENGAS